MAAGGESAATLLLTCLLPRQGALHYSTRFDRGLLRILDGIRPQLLIEALQQRGHRFIRCSGDAARHLRDAPRHLPP